MKIEKSIKIVGLTILFIVSLCGGAWSQVRPVPDVPDYDTLNASIMRPDMDTLLQWIREYRNAPEAYIDKELNFNIPPYGSSLNLLSYLEYTPEERQQGSCGNCWNWAGTGVLEIALSVHGNKVRLSPQYLNSCKTDRYACCGGWLQYFSDWYGQVGFAVPWANSNADYQDGSVQCEVGQSPVSCGSISTNPSYPIASITTEKVTTTGVGQATAIANMKNVLNQNKAIWFGFFLPDFNPFFDFWSGAGASEDKIWNPSTICGQTKIDGGHAVLLVGYDDSDPDPAKHYWLLLNSWATANGLRPHGLFRLAMNLNYDCSLNVNGETAETFTFQTLNVTFGGEGTCTYSLSPTSKTFGSGGGSETVTVNTQTGCTWSATESLDWVTINSGASGNGSGTVSYFVSQNPDPGSRTGTITIAGKTFNITQQGSSTLPDNLISNPDFELGTDDWTQSNIYIITNYPIFAYSGNWFGWLAGYDDADEVLYQDVAIPSDATQASLDFWYWILTDEWESTAYDYLNVEIRRPSDNGLLTTLGYLSNLDQASVWKKINSVDLTSFKGQTIRLMFHATTDPSMLTNFFIDNIGLWVTYPVGETVSTPTTPSGPASGSTGTSYPYSTGGSTSSSGHSVQYYFDWGDSTNSGWLPVGTTSASKTWSAAATYNVKVKARCSTDTSLESGFSNVLAVAIAGGGSETVSAPTTPSGPAGGNTGTSYAYSTSGSTSSLGHSVQYYFDWGDGTNSGWLAVGTTSASKSWSAAATYNVKAKARCSADPSIESGWSGNKTVTISGGGGNGTATRTLPGYYAPSVAISVSIATAPAGTVNSHAVEDTPPPGWTVTNINESGTWDNNNKKVKWGPFFDHNVRTLTYQATPPTGETGSKSFSGTASFDGSNVTIGGTSNIELGGYHPADTDHDFRISIAEVTAYGAAWKTGQTWPTPPNPIPIEYATNAGYIWKVGEVYHYDGAKNPPFDPGP